MSELSGPRIIGQILIAALIYAVAMAIVDAISCTLPNTACRLGVDVSATDAVMFTGVLYTAIGLLAMGALLSPLMVALSRQVQVPLWIAVIVGAIVGVAPLSIPCVWAQGGCVVSHWVPYPAYSFAAAGAVAGAFLWWQWFRHLTTRWSGP
jgi:hypothetical protein